MVIDCILDRYDDDKDGFAENYNPHDFYIAMLRYTDMCGEPISRAMDYGTEEDVQNALCQYIDEQGYNPNIKDYIKSVTWISRDRLHSDVCILPTEEPGKIHDNVIDLRGCHDRDKHYETIRSLCQDGFHWAGSYLGNPTYVSDKGGSLITVTILAGIVEKDGVFTR